jgi:hypothetical protein
MIHEISLSRSIAMLALLFCCLLDDKAATKDDSKDSFKKPVVKEKRKIEVFSPLSAGDKYAPGSNLWLADKEAPTSGDKQKRFFVCKAETFVWKMFKHANANDKEGIALMVKEGYAFIVEGPCSVRVIQCDKIPGFVNLSYEIRIMSGDDVGKSGWVADIQLCNKSQKEVVEVRALTKQEIEDALKKKEALAKSEKDKDEDRAAELLKAAKRWLSEGDKELALRRLDELLKRFPKSAVAEEAKELREKVGK